MYRCPKCNSELSADARFCNTCGFNHTNARMQAASSAPNAPSNAPIRPGVGPGMPMPPSGSQAGMPPMQGRNGPPPAGPGSNGGFAPNAVRPPSQGMPPMQGQNGPPPGSPGSNGGFASNVVQPVRTNTPPRSGPGSAGAPGQMSPMVANSPARPMPPGGPAPAYPAGNPMQLSPEQMQRQRYAAGQAAPQYAQPPTFDPTRNQRRVPLNKSLAVTGKAAEHWRDSWKARQRAEAGPAVGISRGQAAVPEPLMAMQHSIARMRAVMVPKNQEKPFTRGMNIILILLICLTVVLATFVIWSYLPASQSTSQLSAVGNALPSLTVNGASTAAVTAGRALQLHGDHFGPNNAITFIMDNTTINDNNSKLPSVQSNSAGTFDTSLPIPTTWLAGDYALQAQDNQTGQHALLDVQVLPGSTTSVSNTTPLEFTLNGNPIALTGVAFKATLGGRNPAAQQIKLRNVGNGDVQWNVSAVADKDLSWLSASKTGGSLIVGDADTININVTARGLQNNPKAYTGRIIFTIDQSQAIIPVSLLVRDAVVEVVINPNPIIASFQGGGACQATTLTLINLSNQVVTWSASPFDVDKGHINVNDGPFTADQMDPAGQPGDTKTIKITCAGVQIGENLYHIRVVYNVTSTKTVAVSIRQQQQ